ncbi:MAG: glycogen synthase GlgA [Caldithrix sp.]|nr:glycogen synthase GlgA [Caldithrix sp.]
MELKSASKMKIGFISSEIYPFSKTGGLADVAFALGKYLAINGHDIRLITPLYSSIDTKRYPLKRLKEITEVNLWFGSQKYSFTVYIGLIPQSKAMIYFIHCPVLYDRGALYTNDPDEHIRFGLLNRAALELCQKLQWSPDIFHLNDWQTGLLPVYLKTIYNWDRLFDQCRTVMTIHNIGYQGRFKAHVINDLSLSEYHQWFDSSDLYHGHLNFLRTGLLHADKITTVSETYAREIQTADFGEGLQDILQGRAQDLVGILNGVDYETWNPQTDPWISKKYSINRLKDKKENKKFLVERLGLSYSKNTPLIGMVTRLAGQKGIELLDGGLQRLFAEHDVQLIILGSGEQHFERVLYQLQLSYPRQMVFYRGYDTELSHQIEAGADIFLMPSKYEPCGLNQIYSLKYGTVPVVRKTGGLADTVDLYDWKTQKGTGFVFEHFSIKGMYWALDYAINTFKYPEIWKKIMKQAMNKDFSWQKQIKHYENLFESIIQE